MGRPKKATPSVQKAPSRLPGSFDLLPEFHLSWDVFLEKMTELAHTFGYVKTDAPMFENAKLYNFWSEQHASLLLIQDPKGTAIAAKPANIFGLTRIYLEHHYPEREKVSKWYYHSPIAYIINDEIKQSYEYGFQIFGPAVSIADAQLINLLHRLFHEIGLNNLSLEVNSVGCIECQPAYQEQLKNYFKDKKYDLCEDCLEHLENNQPIRILACTNLSCSAVAADAPIILDYICENCRRQFVGVLEGLDELALVYNLNPKVIGNQLSRRTVFEIRAKSETSEVSLGVGGHMDDLIQSLGGVAAPALGFAGTVDMILAALEQAQIKFASKNKVDVFLVPLGDLAAKKTLKLFTELWSHNIIASEFMGPVSIKTQLKLAESNKVSTALIIGQKEARERTVILRDIRSGMQELFTYERIIDEVKKRLGK